MIKLRFAELEYVPEGAVSIFPDGARWGALPHPEMPHYVYLAFRYGHGGDTLDYCRHHELAHHVVCEALGSHSFVIWSLAHGEEPTQMIAAAEEALAMTLHRYALTNEPPFVAGIDWAAARSRFLELAGYA